MKRSHINMLKKADPIRYRRWFSRGKRDGMCGVRRSECASTPKIYREAYNIGYGEGVLLREEA